MKNLIILNANVADISLPGKTTFKVLIRLVRDLVAGQVIHFILNKHIALSGREPTDRSRQFSAMLYLGRDHRMDQPHFCKMASTLFSLKVGIIQRSKHAFMWSASKPFASYGAQPSTHLRDLDNGHSTLLWLSYNLQNSFRFFRGTHPISDKAKQLTTVLLYGRFYVLLSRNSQVSRSAKFWKEWCTSRDFNLNAQRASNGFLGLIECVDFTAKMVDFTVNHY